VKREILKHASWPDDKAWLDLLAPLFMEDARKADCAAKLWNRLLIEIESGEEGATRVAWCLEDALRLTFPFTKVYKACMILFQVSLGDDFPVKDDSLAVLSEAIVRVKIALERGPSRNAKRRKPSRRK
jgi:hypothetical protein